jgi:HEAT repeat protein
MTKRRAIWAASVPAVLVVVGFLVAQVSREPSYHGKSLSEWLDEVRGGIDRIIINPYEREAKIDMARFAVRQIGTNAVPHLIRMLGARDSPTLLKFESLLWKLGIKFATERADVKNQRALAGFEILGHAANSAIPELLSLLNREGSTNATVAMEIRMALTGIGKDSLPFILPLLTNPSPVLRGEAGVALGRLNPGLEVVADIIPLLHDENADVRRDTAVAFSNVRSELALPALIVNLQDTNSNVRRMSAVALGFLGKKGVPAIPALKQAALDPDASVSRAANQALDMISKEP